MFMRTKIVWEVVQMLFYPSRIHYLGHVISSKGIAVGPAKVEAIREWPTSTNVTEVCSFMGLARYYRRFVEGFSKIENMIVEIAEEQQEVF